MEDRAAKIGKRIHHAALQYARQSSVLRKRKQQLRLGYLCGGKRSRLDNAEKRIVHESVQTGPQRAEGRIRQPVEVLVVHEQMHAAIADIGDLKQPVFPRLALDGEVPLLRVATRLIEKGTGQVCSQSG